MPSWELAAIGDICDVVNGGTPKTGVSEYWGGPHRWITPAEMGKRSTPYIDQTDRTITDLGLQNSSARPLPPFSVILSSRAPIGHLVINTEPMATNQGCKGLIPRHRIDHKFLYHYLGSIVDLLNELGTGTTFKELSGGKLKEVKVPIPPLAEQRRIVAILDEAFEGIATTKSSAEKNLQNARELFESYAKNLFALGARRWPAKTIDQISTNLDSKRVPITKSDRKAGEFPYYGASGIVDYVADYIFEGDALLVSEDGANLLARSTPIAFPASGRYWVNNHAHILKFDHLPTQRFVEFYLASIPLDEYITGAAQPKLNQKALNSIPIPIPDAVGDQAQVVNQLEKLAEQCELLEATYERKLAALSELKRTLLHQAFSGQLTSAKSKPFTAAQVLPTISPEFSASVIVLAYERHKRQHREMTFGRVKEQKLLHLVEAIADVELGRHPMKDAAGPNDFPHMLKAEEWAKRNGFFEMVQRDGGYDFKKLPAHDQLLAKAPQVLGNSLAQIESVIDLLVPMDTVEAEVFATVHAAWNNLLIDGAEVTDAAIVWEARDGWHANKLAIPEIKFRQAIAQIRSKGLIPDGTGKYVGGQTSLL